MYHKYINELYNAAALRTIRVLYLTYSLVDRYLIGVYILANTGKNFGAIYF